MTTKNLAALRQLPHVFSVRPMRREEIRQIAHAHVSKASEAVEGSGVPFPLLLYLEHLASADEPAEALDFEIVEDRELPHHMAVYVADTQTVVIRASVYDAGLNDADPSHYEALFTIAHEIGHWALDHCEQSLVPAPEGLEVVALPGCNSEEQADIFAEELLVSTTYLSRAYDNHFKISASFHIAPKRAKKRIRDLAKEGFWASLPRGS